MFKNTLLLISIFFFSFCFSQNGKVVAIKDGDTIVLLDSLNQEHIIRVTDIDCPERGQPFSAKAKEFVSAEVFLKKVSVQKKDTDRYGRIIGFVLFREKMYP
jgi:endonuclease YncB( thermonuclease family)